MLENKNYKIKDNIILDEVLKKSRMKKEKFYKIVDELLKYGMLIKYENGDVMLSEEGKKAMFDLEWYLKTMYSYSINKYMLLVRKCFNQSINNYTSECEAL